MIVARLPTPGSAAHFLGAPKSRLAPVGETMFPPRAPFFRDRLSPRAAAIAAWAEEKERGNLTVSPKAPSLAHGPGTGR
jgi:hypothetical protein